VLFARLPLNPPVRDVVPLRRGELGRLKASLFFLGFEVEPTRSPRCRWGHVPGFRSPATSIWMLEWCHNGGYPTRVHAWIPLFPQPRQGRGPPDADRAPAMALCECRRNLLATMATGSVPGCFQKNRWPGPRWRAPC